jgi:hypothetical protein
LDENKSVTEVKAKLAQQKQLYEESAVSEIPPALGLKPPNFVTVRYKSNTVR